MPLEECLDDGRTGRGATDAILFQCVSQFIVLHQLAGGLHGTQQGCLGIGLGWLCASLFQKGLMRAALPFVKMRQHAVVLVRRVVVGIFLIRAKDDAPTRFQDLLARYLKFHFAHFPLYGRRGDLAVGIEGGYEAAGDQVIHLLLGIAQPPRWYACGDNRMVIGHFGIVEHPFALG